VKTIFERISGAMDPEFPGVRFPEPDPDSPSEQYHEASKLYQSTAVGLGARIEMFLGHRALQNAAANPFKVYATHPRVQLPAPAPMTMGLNQALLERQCVRVYDTSTATPLPLVSDWLGWGCGLVHRGAEGSDKVVRTYPSGGGLYPLELYVAVRNVQDLNAGLYHYNPREHSLEVLGDAATAGAVFENLTQREAADSCHFAVVVTAIFMRSQYKYGERGYRFVLLEAGHLMQNLSLLAPALGLGMVPIGGYYDDKLHDLLGVNGVDEAVVYAAAAGLPAE